MWQDVFPAPALDAEDERERRLALQARAGADWALAALVARYQPTVYRYLVRLTGDEDVAYRLAERIFIRMSHRLRGPQGATHLRLWLLRASTESGLDALRTPRKGPVAQLDAPAAQPRAMGLLPPHAMGQVGLRARMGLDRLARATGTTLRQSRQLVWNSQPSDPQPGSDEVIAEHVRRAYDEHMARDPLADRPDNDPREVLRQKMIRAVLVELPYGDAQCLALHLIAGLNQAQVGHALGIRATAARRRIVQGLEIFGLRYESLVTGLGLSREFMAPGGQSADLFDDADETLTEQHAIAQAKVVPSVPSEPSEPSDPAPTYERDDRVVGRPGPRPTPRIESLSDAQPDAAPAWYGGASDAPTHRAHGDDSGPSESAARARLTPVIEAGAAVVLGAVSSVAVGTLVADEAAPVVEPTFVVARRMPAEKPPLPEVEAETLLGVLDLPAAHLVVDADAPVVVDALDVSAPPDDVFAEAPKAPSQDTQVALQPAEAVTGEAPDASAWIEDSIITTRLRLPDDRTSDAPPVAPAIVAEDTAPAVTDVPAQTPATSGVTDTRTTGMPSAELDDVPAAAAMIPVLTASAAEPETGERPAVVPVLTDRATSR